MVVVVVVIEASHHHHHHHGHHRQDNHGLLLLLCFPCLPPCRLPLNLSPLATIWSLRSLRSSALPMAFAGSCCCCCFPILPFPPLLFRDSALSNSLVSSFSSSSSSSSSSFSSALHSLSCLVTQTHTHTHTINSGTCYGLSGGGVIAAPTANISSSSSS